MKHYLGPIFVMLFLLLVFCAILADNLHCAEKKKVAPDSTVTMMAVKDFIAGLEAQQKQITDGANAQLQQIQGQIKLLQYLKQDSVAVPKEPKP